MPEPADYEPCLPVISVLSNSLEALGESCARLAETWGDFRLFAPGYVFDETDYYREEMGVGLFRWWGYRRTLEDPSKLVNWKKATDAIEDDFRDGSNNRTVNIDPGYVNLGLLVLGSHKNHHQKIYLGDGVYADPILEYVDGSFRPFHWSFPDFQDERYYRLLETLRERYKDLR